MVALSASVGENSARCEDPPPNCCYRETLPDLFPHPNLPWGLVVEEGRVGQRMKKILPFRLSRCQGNKESGSQGFLVASQTREIQALDFAYGDGFRNCRRTRSCSSGGNSFHLLSLSRIL
jgi:hypothetical protein